MMIQVNMNKKKHRKRQTRVKLIKTLYKLGCGIGCTLTCYRCYCCCYYRAVVVMDIYNNY